MKHGADELIASYKCGIDDMLGKGGIVDRGRRPRVRARVPSRRSRKTTTMRPPRVIAKAAQRCWYYALVSIITRRSFSPLTYSGPSPPALNPSVQIRYFLLPGAIVSAAARVPPRDKNVINDARSLAASLNGRLRSSSGNILGTRRVNLAREGGSTVCRDDSLVAVSDQPVN